MSEPKSVLSFYQEDGVLQASGELERLLRMETAAKLKLASNLLLAATAPNAPEKGKFLGAYLAKIYALGFAHIRLGAELLGRLDAQVAAGARRGLSLELETLRQLFLEKENSATLGGSKWGKK